MRVRATLASLALAAVSIGQGASESSGKELPKAFKDAATFVLQHGLADPRGGRLVSADTASGAKIGWLVPAKNGKPEYLAATDGLGYEKVSKVKDVEESTLFSAGPPNPGPFLGHDQGFSAVPLAAAMAYLHGDESIAYRLSENAVNVKPYFWLYWFSHDYLADRLARATLEHEQADDIGALADAKAIQAEQGAFQREAARQVGPNNKLLPTLPTLGDKRYFPFVQLADPIATDSARRIKLGSPHYPDLGAIARQDQHQRITSLITALDQVVPESGPDYDKPTYAEEPTFKALVREGQDAVEPLIAAFEKDDRLTRAHWRQMFTPNAGPQPFVTVRAVEFAALQTILQFNLIGTVENRWSVAQQPQATAKALRSYWSRIKGLTPAQSWVKVLQDDHAGDRAWFEATQRLADPVGALRPADTRPITSSSGTLQGDSLTNSEHGQLVTILSRRATETASLTPPNDVRHPFELNEALQMAIYMAKLSSNAALDTLRDVSLRAISSAPKSGQEYYVTPLAEAMSYRARLGDEDALSEYGTWIAQLQPHNGGLQDMYFARVFEPLVEFRDRQVMKNLAAKVFLDKASPWNQALMAKHSSPLLPSPLLDVPAFAKNTLDALDDKTVIGKTGRYGRAVNTPSTSYMLPKDLVLPPGTPQTQENTYRTCDSVAMSLRDLDGAPKFEPYWSDAEKDSAIGQLKAFLEQNAGRLASRLRWPANWKDYPKG